MGMPRLRQAYTPHPVVDQSAAHLRAYIDGSDAISGRPFMQVVLDGLTVPLEDADLHGLSFERTTIAILPWLVPLLASLIFITYVPKAVLWLPKMFY